MRNHIPWFPPVNLFLCLTVATWKLVPALPTPCETKPSFKGCAPFFNSCTHTWQYGLSVASESGYGLWLSTYTCASSPSDHTHVFTLLVIYRLYLQGCRLRLGLSRSQQIQGTQWRMKGTVVVALELRFRTMPTCIRIFMLPDVCVTLHRFFINIGLNLSG